MSRLRYFLRYPPFRPPLHFRPSSAVLRNIQPPPFVPLPLQSRFRWSYLWYASILGFGITTGLAVRQFAAPLGLVEPGTPEDQLILENLEKDIDRLGIVQSLRKQSFNLHTDAPLSTSGAGDKFKVKGWVEVDVDSRRDVLGGKGLLDAMSGTRGLGVQRAFWNAETGELVAVVWIGGGLAGWPGVAHGGAIATIFEETMARMVKGPDGDIEPKHRPDSISITYAKPTYSLDFYILRASFSKPNRPQTEPPPEPESEPTKSWLSWLSPKKDFTKQIESKRQNAEIIGTLESVKGDLCVKVKGTFSVPGPEIREKLW